MSQPKIYIPDASTNMDLWSIINIPSRGENLYKFLKEGFAYHIFETLAKLSSLDKKEFAKIVVIPPATLRRRSATGRFTKDESDRLYRYAEVMASAIELFEGDQKAVNNWLNKKNKGLGDKEPINMLSTTAETEAVLDLIGRLEQGVFV